MNVRRADLALLWLWTVTRLRITRRSSRAAFFTFVFPLLLLVILNAASQGSRVDVTGGRIDFAQFFTPSIAIFALLTSCYTGTIFSVASARDMGVLKRVRTTPLPPWIYVTSRLAGAVLIGLAAVGVMFAVAVPVFGVHVYPRLLPAAVVTLVVGGVSLAALGLAVSTFVSAESAPVVANLTLFPVIFVSGIFFPMDGAPEWLQELSHLTPVSHLVDAFHACFTPFTSGSGFAWRDLAVVAIWGAVGLRVAIKYFRWEPTPERGSTLRRRRRPAAPSRPQS